MNFIYYFNSFQYLFLGILLVLLVGIIIALSRRWASRREGIAWISLCLAAAAATIWPDMTTRIARAIGISRGADLILYCAVAVMMIGFWMTYIRLRHLRREMTLLVRHAALLEAERDYGLADAGPNGESNSPNSEK